MGVVGLLSLMPPTGHPSKFPPISKKHNPLFAIERTAYRHVPARLAHFRGCSSPCREHLSSGDSFEAVSRINPGGVAYASSLAETWKMTMP